MVDRPDVEANKAILQAQAIHMFSERITRAALGCLYKAVKP